MRENLEVFTQKDLATLFADLLRTVTCIVEDQSFSLANEEANDEVLTSAVAKASIFHFPYTQVRTEKVTENLQFLHCVSTLALVSLESKAPAPKSLEMLVCSLHGKGESDFATSSLSLALSLSLSLYPRL